MQPPPSREHPLRNPDEPPSAENYVTCGADTASTGKPCRWPAKMHYEHFQWVPCPLHQRHEYKVHVEVLKAKQKLEARR